MRMIPVGYMAKRIRKKPEWLKAAYVIDIYSVSNCISEHFADYIPFWEHNGWWFFDSPEVIRKIAKENQISLDQVSLFYYEVFEREFVGNGWLPIVPEEGCATDVVAPRTKVLAGFDVV